MKVAISTPEFPYKEKRLLPKGFKNITKDNFSFDAKIPPFKITRSSSDQLTLFYQNDKIHSSFSPKKDGNYRIGNENFLFDTSKPTPLGFRVPNTNQFFYFGKENFRANIYAKNGPLETKYDFTIGANPRFHLQIHRMNPFYTLGYVYYQSQYTFYTCAKNNTKKLESAVTLSGIHLKSPSYLLVTLRANNGKIRIGFVNVGIDQTLNLHWMIQVPFKDMLFMNSFTARKGYIGGIKKNFSKEKLTLTALASTSHVTLGAAFSLMDSIKCDFNVAIDQNFKTKFDFHFDFTSKDHF